MAIAKKYPNGGTGGWNPKSRVEPVTREYTKEPTPNPMVKQGLIENIKEKKWIVLGLVAVAGFFAYKKFKK